MMKTFSRKLAVLTLASLASGAGHAGETCLMDWWTNGSSLVGNADSWAIATTQARNTWDDWVWRGPTFYCNAAGSGCSYSYSQSHTTGYWWAVGGSISLPNIPIINKVIGGFELSGTYTRQTSWTDGFTWTQTIKGGQYAQPVQVVRRRWKHGYFQGGYRATNSACNVSDTGSGTWYWWDGSARFGSWSANVEESRFVMYHIWN